MYYCLECNKKLCKACFENQHEGHKHCICDPEYLVCSHVADKVPTFPDVDDGLDIMLLYVIRMIYVLEHVQEENVERIESFTNFLEFDQIAWLFGLLLIVPKTFTFDDIR